MKKWIVILFFLHLSLGLEAQVFNNAYNNYNHIFTTFTVGEDLYNYDGFGDVFIDDTVIYCYGWSTIPQTFLDTQKLAYTYFIKLNSFGDTLKTKEFLLNSNELSVVGAPLKTDVDEFITFGYTKGAYYSSEEKGIIIKHNSNLDILEIDSFDIYDSSEFDAAKYVNNKYYLLSQTDIDTSSDFNFDFNLIVLNDNDSILLNYNFGGPDTDLNTSFEVLDNGNIIISGVTRSFGAGDVDLYLLEIDSLGNTLWDQTYGFPGRDINSSNGLKILHNEIYLSGFTELIDGNFVGWLIKTDSLGNLLWEKKFDRGPLFDGFVSMDVASDGNILLAGSTHNYDIQGQDATGWLLKVDTSGNIIWERFPSMYDNQGNSDDYINRMKIDDNGYIYLSGYLIGGAIQTNGVFHANDAWLCKTDSCGFTANNPTEAMLVVDSIVNATVYISNLSEEYCTGHYMISNDNGIIDSLDVYAYSQWANGANPNQMQYTFQDTGAYEITLSVIGGDSTASYTVQFNIQDTASSIKPSSAWENSIHIFPNPAKDYLVIQNDFNNGNTSTNNMSCNIYTTTGQAIKSYELNPSLYQQRIFIDDIANGVYLLNFTADGLSVGNKRLSVVK